jgi:hypothetical protein
VCVRVCVLTSVLYTNPYWVCVMCVCVLSIRTMVYVTGRSYSRILEFQTSDPESLPRERFNSAYGSGSAFVIWGAAQ